MRKYRLFDIKWDTSDEENSDGGNFEELGLPNEVFVNIEDDDIFDPYEDGADYLSDSYGFCLFGYGVEEIT